MKSLLACAGALIAAASLGLAQTPDATETKVVAGDTITIKYSSPPVKDQAGKIFAKDGALSKISSYPVWSATAGPATMLHTDADLAIGDLTIPGEASGSESKGWFTLYVDISDPNNWTLIVNKELHQWGLTYNKDQDLGRVKMTMSKPAAPVANLKYTLTDLGGNKGRLELAWDNEAGSVDFTVK